MEEKRSVLSPSEWLVMECLWAGPKTLMELVRALKDSAEWTLVLPCCCGNGYEGYFPTADAFTNGSYEVRSSIFKAGVAEAIIDTGSALLHELQQDRRN